MLRQLSGLAARQQLKGWLATLMVANILVLLLFRKKEKCRIKIKYKGGKQVFVIQAGRHKTFSFRLTFFRKEESTHPIMWRRVSAFAGLLRLSEHDKVVWIIAERKDVPSLLSNGCRANACQWCAVNQTGESQKLFRVRVLGILLLAGKNTPLSRLYAVGSLYRFSESNIKRMKRKSKANLSRYHWRNSIWSYIRNTRPRHRNLLNPEWTRSSLIINKSSRILF